MKKLFLICVALAFAPASYAATLENYYSCSFAPGKTMADILKFKAEYQADITKNFEGYSVKVLSPMYVGDSMAEADFVWYGGFQRADMDKIMSWFRSTNWAQQFSANMTCSTSSLWMAL